MVERKCFSLAIALTNAIHDENLSKRFDPNFTMSFTFVLLTVTYGLISLSVSVFSNGKSGIMCCVEVPLSTSSLVKKSGPSSQELFLICEA